MLSKINSQEGFRVSEKNKKSNADNVDQMLKRVMTVAELLTTRSAEEITNEQPKTQESESAVK